jgi:tetratricopeptide (TPR) repeat protein
MQWRLTIAATSCLTSIVRKKRWNACNRALALKPDYAEALNNRGIALSLMGRREEAGNDFERALELRPDLPFARGMLLYSRLYCCDWRSYEEQSRQLIADVRSAKPSAPR